MATTAQQMRTFRGLPVLSAGFRPFYLLAAGWSAVMVPVWIWVFAGGGTLPSGITVTWHAHEMLFGVLGGIIAGFLLTAIPNWTGRLPVTGVNLALLAGVWCAGRIAMLMPGWAGLMAGWVDCLFLFGLAGVVWREILAGRNWRNLPIGVMVSGLALANLAFHLGAADLSIRLALAIILVLIGLIGGRIIPSFTTNWLKKAGVTKGAPAFNRQDLAVLIVTAVALLSWSVFPAASLAGMILIVAGVVNAWRLSRWRGLATLSEPLVWILHLGYAWLVVGLLLLGASGLGVVPMSAGLHALTAGAIGVMCLAVMTRSTLGHTGRALRADFATTGIYGLIMLAAVVRVVSALWPEAYVVGLTVSAALWMLGFGLFVVAYGPKLLTPRLAT